MIICLKNISKSFATTYKKEPLFENITMQFSQGVSYALTGVSGCGKSTFLHILADLETPSAGTIVWYDTRGTKHIALSADMRVSFLSMIFQKPYLISELNVLENSMLKGLISGMPYDLARTKAEERLRLVDLFSIRFQSIYTLSGGQQQRLCLAQALFFDPTLILADEPTAHLDTIQGHYIMKYLTTYARTHKACLVVATHDTQVAESLDEIYIINNPCIIKQKRF